MHRKKVQLPGCSKTTSSISELQNLSHVLVCASFSPNNTDNVIIELCLINAEDINKMQNIITTNPETWSLKCQFYDKTTMLLMLFVKENALNILY